MRKQGKRALSILLVFMLIMQLATTAFAYTVPTSDSDTADDDSGIKLEQQSYDSTTGILTMRVSGKMSSEMGYSSIGVLITFDNTKLTLNHRTSGITYAGTEDTFVTSGIANTVNTLLYYGNDPEEDGGYYTSQTPAIYKLDNRTAYYVYHHSGGNPIGSLQETDGWIPIFEFRLKVEGNPSDLSTVLDKDSIRFGDVSKDQTVMDGVFGAANEFSVTAIDTDIQANYRYFGEMSNSPIITSTDTDKKFMPATITYDGAGNVTLGSLEVTPTIDTISVPTTGTSSTTAPVVTALDTDGDRMTTPEITWSFTPATAPAGVTYNSDGSITVGKTAQSGTVTVTTSSGGIHASQVITITRETSVATSISISGDSSIIVPTSGSTPKTYTATVLDQYGDTISSPSITWSTSSSATGVNFEISTGVLTVANTAGASGSVSFTINAQSGSATDSKTISISRESAWVSTVVVAGGQSEITVPIDGTSANTSSAFTASVTDQYGIAYAGTVSWSIIDAPAGISIGDDGVVTATNAAKAAISDTTGTSFTVTATCGGVSDTATITVKRVTAEATSVVIYNDSACTSATGISDTLVISTTSTPNEKQYYAKTYDQYGTEFSDTQTWSFATADTFVTHSDGKVSVAQGATVDETYVLTVNGANSTTVFVTITVKDIEVDWDDIVAKSSITYGDFKASAFTTLPDVGTATATSVLDGTFSIVDASDILSAGNGQTITVKFIVTTAGVYKDTEITKDYTIDVAPKTITVTVAAASREYGAANPPFSATAASGVLVSNDTVADLDLTLSSTANSTSAPGSYAVTGTANNSNYDVTVFGTDKLTVTKAALSLTGTASFTGILANNSSNDFLLTLTSAVQAANSSLSASHANGTETLDATWVLKTGTFDRKGGTYTFEATLTPTDSTNFSYSGAKAEVTVTVTPVIGTITYTPTTLTKVESEIGTAVDMAAIGLPTSVAVSYNNGVSGDSYNITSWNYTLAQLQAIDASSSDVQRELIPTVTFPAWATINTSDMKTALTITSKYPVTVNVATPAGVIYGTALGGPTPSQTEINNGIDGSATWEYFYIGTTRAGTAYSSETKPTQAGTYTVKATLVSNTHSGSGTSSEFTISPKPLASDMISVTGTYKFTGSAIVPNYTVTDGSSLASNDYDAAVTNNVNAGDGKITVTAKDTGNYSGEVDKTFAIAKDDAPSVNDIEHEYNKDNPTTGVSIDLAALLPNNCGTVSYDLTKLGTAVTSGAVVDGDGILTFDTIAGTDGDEEELSIEVTMQNYENVTIKVTITLVDKITPVGTPTVTGSLNYGQTLSNLSISATMTDGAGGTVVGEITWETPASIPVVGAPDQAWVFTPEDDNTYLSAYGTIVITVNKSTPSGTPIYDKISASGKTLADANLDGVFTNAYSGESVPGTLVWDDGDAEAVTANKSYGWTFTSDDTDNYNVATGSITVYTSGGGYTPSNPPVDGKTETIGNSTVTTPAGKDPVTNDDGMVTLPSGGTVEVGSGSNAVVVDAPAGTVVASNGSVTIPDNKEADVELTDANATVTVPGGSTISSSGAITVGDGEATIVLPNKTEITILEGSSIVGNRVNIGDRGATVTSGGGSATIAEGVTLILDEDVPLGYYVVNPFNDVKSSDWFYDAVMYAYENGIINGTGSSTFESNVNLSRTMMVQILYNYEGKPSDGTPGFDDVSNSAWYADAVAWAADNKIVEGYGDGNFGPLDEITREQMAAILYRYCNSKGINLPATRSSGSFTDSSSISFWATEVVDAMYKAEILNGKGNGIFDPQGKATRAEVAQMMMNFLEAIK